MVRPLLWLLGGLGVLVLAVLAIAPELLGGALFSALGLALVAAVPAVLVAVLFVSSRRRRGLPPRGSAAPTPTPAPPPPPDPAPSPAPHPTDADGRPPGTDRGA